MPEERSEKEKEVISLIVAKAFLLTLEMIQENVPVGAVKSVLRTALFMLEEFERLDIPGKEFNAPDCMKVGEACAQMILDDYRRDQADDREPEG